MRAGSGAVISAVCLLVASVAAFGQGGGDDVLDVGLVWSGHPVSFCLLTHGDMQFVAFYDEDRQMTVASRRLDSRRWRFKKLPERVGWDSHNSITMTVDDNECIHLSGNMHCVPLVYFRTSEPLDISTFERFGNMVGAQESRCTYPHFFRGADNELIYTYRDGGSGNGNQIYNVYDPDARTWRRLLDKPLADGQGKMNAYLRGPSKGADGYFHLVWVWRDTPDCATNHDVSYARSRNLVKWENCRGEKIELPFTVESDVIVDPVKPGGGLINGNAISGFDSQGRLIVSYHKHDESGNTQIYNARLEDGKWVMYKTSDWDYRWQFSGGGSIGFEIRVYPVQVQHRTGGAKLTQRYSHKKFGSGAWELDEKTLKPIDTLAVLREYPRELSKPESSHPGMQVNWGGDLGGSGRAGVRYALRWETQGRNRDRPHEGPLPAPSMLRLHRIESFE